MKEEVFKGYWHAAVATALGVMAGYNAMRFFATRTPRNAFNTGLYTALCAYEWTQAQEHWSQPK